MVQRQKVAAQPDGTLHDIHMGEVSNGDSSKDATLTGETPAQDSGVRLQKTMGLPSACAAIVGTIIGSGIFVSPKGILREVQSVGVSLIIWLGAGLLCSLGGLTYAELGTMMPESGGAYAYIRHSFGDFCGFLYMWAISVIIIPAHDAVIAITFAQYIAQPFFPSCDAIPPAVITILGILAISELSSFFQSYLSHRCSTYRGKI
jgi:amino acid transporter